MDGMKLGVVNKLSCNQNMVVVVMVLLACGWSLPSALAEEVLSTSIERCHP